MEKDFYHVGIKFDKWVPAVESAVFRDLVTLQDKGPIMVICDSSEIDRLLRSLGIMRLSVENLATLWILYQAEEQVQAPDCATQTITRNFISEAKKSMLDLQPRVSVTLPEQGRPNRYNPFEQSPPANYPGVPVDPRVALFFT